MKFKLRTAFAAAVLMTLVGSLSAAEPAWTSIAVKDMCCAGCSQKIAARLYAVRGVKEVRVDMKTKTLFVAPQQSVTLSPLAMWVAVEKAKDTPLMLKGPSGTFKKKPNF